jgi:tetratricopeptide (TPR) repeat protein
MSRNVLDVARRLMKRRKFADALTLLEGRSEIYEDNFDYYLLLGTACLYVGDAGTAMAYYNKARAIKITDTNLLLGQAAIFLRRGDTEKAVRYYLDIQEYAPGNKKASKALDFIRTCGDYDTICRWVDSGRIERFYPPLGFNSARFAGLLVLFVAAVLLVFLLPRVLPLKKTTVGPRANLSSFVLSVEERTNAQTEDLSGGVYHYILTNSEINDAYTKAQKYFQEYRDNASLVELNRLLNSNASLYIKRKARLLVSYLAAPTFDSLKDNYSYAQVAADPILYMDCWVAWSGRIANMQQTGSLYSCDLFVGYETMKKVDGIVPVYFSSVPVPPIDGARPVRILGKIGVDGGKIKLDAKSVYQSVNGAQNMKSGEKQ